VSRRVLEWREEAARLPLSTCPRPPVLGSRSRKRAGASLKGKPASADGGKGVEAGTIVHAQTPELPGQASKATGVFVRVNR
jgi:hypothetical protein